MPQKRDFIWMPDLSPGEVQQIHSRARELKRLREERAVVRSLEGRTLAMIFEKPSSRSRVSFEVGLAQLGGHGVYLDPASIQMGTRETVSDIARVLSGYVDAIFARTIRHSTVEELARWATVPVINGLSDMYHPCQILSDLFTVEETLGRLKEVTLAYVGDGNNVAHSLALGCGMMGMHFRFAGPEGYAMKGEVLTRARALATASGGSILWWSDPALAVAEADIVYTDAWASMGQESEREERLPVFRRYQVNDELLRLAPLGALVMHCLPAHRGEEISEEVLESRRYIAFAQAANRLHVQKALLEFLILG